MTTESKSLRFEGGSDNRTPSLRELFPAARLLCVCTEDRDACHAGCSWFKERSAEIRHWLAKAEAVDEVS